MPSAYEKNLKIVEQGKKPKSKKKKKSKVSK